MFYDGTMYDKLTVMFMTVPCIVSFVMFYDGTMYCKLCDVL